MTNSNDQVAQLRRLGRTLPAEQMDICFEGANRIVELEGQLINDKQYWQDLEHRQWLRFDEQLKRADKLQAELERVKKKANDTKRIIK